MNRNSPYHQPQQQPQPQPQQQAQSHLNIKGFRFPLLFGITANPSSLRHDAQPELCNFGLHVCRREKLPGYEFCVRHILEDKTAPYKPCNFHFRSHRRCTRPAPMSDKKEGYCTEHARKALIARQKTGFKKRAMDVPQRCLEALSHYQVLPHVKQEEAMMAVIKPSPDDAEQALHSRQLLTRAVAPVAGIVRSGSEVESDDDSATVEAAWRGDGDSDAESVDSESENPFRYSGIYTAEEIIRIMRDKLIRLQKLYIDQFQRLRYILREERRAYRMGLQREHEAELATIHTQPKETLDEQAAYEEIKALTHFNKPHGLEAALQVELLEKRLRFSESMATSMMNMISPSPASVAAAAAAASAALCSTSLGVATGPKPKCSYSLTSTTKCGEACVPLSKLCIKHILQDPNQVLFRPCGANMAGRDDGHPNVEDDGPCETPVPNTFDSSACIFHSQFQPAVAPCLYDQVCRADVAVNTDFCENGHRVEAKGPTITSETEASSDSVAAALRPKQSESPPAADMCIH